jgi:hypothetical protein
MIRDFKQDQEDVQAFCIKYGFGYGETIYYEEEYSIFFMELNDHAVQWCMTKNTDYTSSRVDYDDIIFTVPVHEQNMKTDVCAELKAFCKSSDEFWWMTDLSGSDSIEMTEDLFRHPEKLNDIFRDEESLRKYREGCEQESFTK